MDDNAGILWFGTYLHIWRQLWDQQLDSSKPAREMTGFASFKPAVSTQQSRLWLLTPFLHLMCWLIQFLLIEKPYVILLIKLNKLYKFYANHDEIFFFLGKKYFLLYWNASHLQIKYESPLAGAGPMLWPKLALPLRWKRTLRTNKDSEKNSTHWFENFRPSQVYILTSLILKNEKRLWLFPVSLTVSWYIVVYSH